MTGDDTASASAGARRHDRVRYHLAPDPRNSLQYWTGTKPVQRVMLSYVFVLVAHIAPSPKLRSRALRCIDITIGRNVSWGLKTMPDVFQSEPVIIEDDAIIGYNPVILCHEFLQDKYRASEAVAGERTMMGARVTILSGARIDESTQVMTNSLVTHDVPAGEAVASVSVRPMSGNEIDGV